MNQLALIVIIVFTHLMSKNPNQNPPRRLILFIIFDFKSFHLYSFENSQAFFMELVRRIHWRGEKTAARFNEVSQLQKYDVELLHFH